jgi:hypothetical protein
MSGTAQSTTAMRRAQEVLKADGLKPGGRQQSNGSAMSVNDSLLRSSDHGPAFAQGRTLILDI